MLYDPFRGIFEREPGYPKSLWDLFIYFLEGGAVMADLAIGCAEQLVTEWGYREE
jgi:hypothetical protein